MDKGEGDIQKQKSIVVQNAMEQESVKNATVWDC